MYIYCSALQLLVIHVLIILLVVITVVLLSCSVFQECEWECAAAGGRRPRLSRCPV